MARVNAGLIAATGLLQASSVGRGGSSSQISSGGMPATRTSNADNGGGGNQNINISGIDRSSLISGGQLVDTLNQALGDGFTINFAGG